MPDGRFAHVQAQVGEKGERPWAAFEIDVSGLSLLLRNQERRLIDLCRTMG